MPWLSPTIDPDIDTIRPPQRFSGLKQRLDQYMVGNPLTDTSMFSSLPKTLSDEMKQILVLSEHLDLSASEALFISQVDWLLKRERSTTPVTSIVGTCTQASGLMWLGELLDRSTDHKWSAKELRDEMTLFIERSHAYLDQLMVGAETGYGIDSVNLQRVKEELNAELNNPTEIQFPKWARDGSQSTERPHFQGARDTLKMEGQRLV